MVVQVYFVGGRGRITVLVSWPVSLALHSPLQHWHMEKEWQFPFLLNSIGD